MPDSPRFASTLGTRRFLGANQTGNHWGHGRRRKTTLAATYDKNTLNDVKSGPFCRPPRTRHDERPFVRRNADPLRHSRRSVGLDRAHRSGLLARSPARVDAAPGRIFQRSGLSRRASTRSRCTVTWRSSLRRCASRASRGRCASRRRSARWTTCATYTRRSASSM